ncbi:Proliferating cell nuclear antigen [Rhizoctonia solani]|uniref:DNA sliding clamp PCNA n=1 Tax=Rhizoctonia solani TaxID=456999 RepID=A0A8H7M3H5_9AGAM|nr:Proliferating cell nuclear antigen [Rhizoctonia solani]
MAPIKELVTDANFECGDEGLKLQAMDNSHVALVAVQLEPEGFGKYRCDRPMPLGVNLGSLTKVLKCAKDDDRVTLKAMTTLTYSSTFVDSDRIAEYEMKLMEIDIDTLGIPETDYDATVRPRRVGQDRGYQGRNRFSADGEAANGSVLLKATEGARERYKDLDGKDAKTKVKKEKGDKPRKRKKTDDADVKMEDADEDVEEDDGGEKLFKPASEDGEAEKEDDEEAGSDGEEESDGASKKRKRSSQPKKSKNDDGDSSGGVMVELGQSVNLTFSLKYLVNFSKSTSLANTVTLKMSNEVPLLVHYKFDQGHIQYYLAPKIGDE